MAKAKSKSFIARAGQYLAGGTLYFWVGYGLFALAFSVFGWNWFFSKVFGDIIGRSANYVVQRYWTFSDTTKAEKSHLERYMVITIISITLDYIIVGGFVATGVSPYVGQLISAGFFTIWNYWWFKRWVFIPKK